MDWMTMTMAEAEMGAYVDGVTLVVSVQGMRGKRVGCMGRTADWVLLVHIVLGFASRQIPTMRHHLGYGGHICNECLAYISKSILRKPN